MQLRPKALVPVRPSYHFAIRLAQGLCTCQLAGKDGLGVAAL